MRQIRKLYMQNENGARWDLNGGQHTYASHLSGFGFSLTVGFADLTRGFFLPINSKNDPQNSLAMTLTFTRSPYETYQQFLSWISAAKRLTLIYAPSGTTEYCRDVSISFLQKSELTAVGWLECPCSLVCLTPWYLPSPSTLSLEAGGTDTSKRYDYEYSDALMYGEDSAASISGTIAGAGHIPAALDLTFFGEILNPRIRLRGNISGKIYGICSIATELKPSDRLMYSSRYDESYVKKISASGDETDLLDNIDLQTVPFFRIPTDEPCTIMLEADDAFVGHADLLVSYYYRSV